MTTPRGWYFDGWLIVVAAVVAAPIIAWGAWHDDSAAWRRVVAWLAAGVVVAVGVFVARRLRRAGWLRDNARGEDQDQGQP